MKVEAIRLINFMAFEDTGWIELRPITLLFGRNSSGKSAIIRALLLLKQSLDAVGVEQPLAFVKEDGLADLGGFTTAVHRKTGEGPDESQKQDYLDRSIVFGFRCDLTGEPVLDRVQKLVKASEAVSVTEDELHKLARVELLIGFGWYEESVKVNLLDLRVAGTEPPIVLLECKRLEDSDVQDLDFQLGFVLNSDVAHEPQFNEMTIDLHRRAKRGFWTTFANPVPQSFKELDEILRDVQDGVEAFLRGIVHVGPIRPHPERIYALRATHEPHYVREGLKGWYNFLRNRVDQPQADSIAAWMKRMGLADVVKVDADRDTKPVLRSQVSVNDKVEGVNVKDVGFGASQVLPVVAAAVLAEPESLVIIEQPELHLHTFAQIELGDLFVQAQRPVRVGDQWEQKRFLLESHSEHLLLRFQRQVGRNELLRAKCEMRGKQRAKGDSKPFTPVIRSDDVVAVFAGRQLSGCSEIESISFKKDGQLDNPSEAFQDFFRQDYDEVTAILDVSARLHTLTKSNETRVY